MATHNVLARWVAPGGAPRQRLVFFPHAGAGGLTGRSLATDDTEVLAHRRPGRESRMAEPALTSVDAVVDEALSALLPILDADDLPTDILGHSFGAVPAAELVARLERERPGRVRQLVVSAKTPPPDPSPEVAAALRDEQSLIEWLMSLGGTAAELLEDPGMRAMILDPLRCDLQISLNHRAVPPRLTTPLLIVTSDGDTTAPSHTVAAWADVTSAPVATLQLRGGHHALFEQPERVHAALRAPITDRESPEQ